MSDGQYGPEYTLYGVICHAGGGPNSGHYNAFVKSRSGRWYEMNDESVDSARFQPWKSAYILFYMQDKGQKLASSLDSRHNTSQQATKGGIVEGMKKRKAPGDDEDVGVKVSQPFIGPILPTSSPAPSPPKKLKLSEADPQAEKLKRRISLSQSSTPLTGSTGAFSNLANYGSDDSDAENRPPRPVPSGSSPTHDRASPHPEHPPLSSPPQSSPVLAPKLPPTPVQSVGSVSSKAFYGTHSTPGADKARARLGNGPSPKNQNPNWMTKQAGFNPLNRRTYGRKQNRGL
jgi:ubiquitin carboxyl-terminal hydrolase 36/42